MAVPPIVLPTRQKNRLTILSTATETIADLANHCIRSNASPLAHKLNEKAEVVMSSFLVQEVPSGHINPDVLPPYDPSLSTARVPVSCADMCADGCVALAQTNSTSKHVQPILMRTIDDDMRPLEDTDNTSHRTPVSPQKLLKGDCSWSTVKLVLGLSINTESQTPPPPPQSCPRPTVCSTPG